MEKIRYTKQYDHYSCGPVAIINALKWAGYSASLKKDKPRILKISKCKPPKGTSVFNLNKAILRCLELDLEYDDCPDLRTLRAHLRTRQGAAILRYKWWSKKRKCWQGHYFLTTGLTSSGKYYYVINMFTGKVKQRRLAKKFIKELSRNREQLRCWYLTKSS